MDAKILEGIAMRAADAADQGQFRSCKLENCKVALRLPNLSHNIGALMVRIEFWCPLYYNYDKEPPK